MRCKPGYRRTVRCSRSAPAPGNTLCTWRRGCRICYWLPSDRPRVIPDLALRMQTEPSPNLLPPVALDVCCGPWPAGPFTAAYAANIAHIMPWAAVLATLNGLQSCLLPGAGFFLYGPFRVSGDFTSAGNRAFDQSLRDQDPAMGLRDLEALESAAVDHHFKLDECIEMPANNLLLVLRRQGPAEDG